MAPISCIHEEEYMHYLHLFLLSPSQLNGHVMQLKFWFILVEARSLLKKTFYYLILPYNQFFQFLLNNIWGSLALHIIHQWGNSNALGTRSYLLTLFNSFLMPLFLNIFCTNVVFFLTCHSYQFLDSLHFTLSLETIFSYSFSLFLPMHSMLILFTRTFVSF